MESIKVLLVDDHEIVRKGVQLLFEGESEIEVIEETSSGEEAIEFVKDNFVDIILSDITLPGMSGIDLVKEIHEKHPKISMLMFSMHAEDEYIIDALNAGAKGYIPKVVDQFEIVSAIKEISEGRMYFNNSVSGALARQIRSLNNGKKSKDKLSEREVEVVNHIVKGLNNKEIADKLFLSKRTIDNHRSNLMKKLGARNTADIVRIAINTGIVGI